MYALQNDTLFTVKLLRIVLKIGCEDYKSVIYEAFEY